MTTQTQLTFEAIVDEMFALDRPALIEALTHFAPFPLDLAPDYLAACPTEKLRHLLAAALWRAQTRVQPHA